jgi:A/G-specific adenine glycosylase
LPGVGRYTANAVLALAFNKAAPLLDPNVIRVLERLLETRSSRARPRDDPLLWQLVHSLIPRRRPAAFGLALVDLGAVVCRPRRPRCAHCPLSARCRAFRAGAVRPAEP